MRGVAGGAFDFWGKSRPFSSPGALVRLRHRAIRIGDTGFLSLISRFSKIVQEISTGCWRRFDSGISKASDRAERLAISRGFLICIPFGLSPAVRLLLYLLGSSVIRGLVALWRFAVRFAISCLSKSLEVSETDQLLC